MGRGDGGVLSSKDDVSGGKSALLWLCCSFSEPLFVPKVVHSVLVTFLLLFFFRVSLITRWHSRNRGTPLQLLYILYYTLKANVTSPCRSSSWHAAVICFLIWCCDRLSPSLTCNLYHGRSIWADAESHREIVVFDYSAGSLRFSSLTAAVLRSLCVCTFEVWKVKDAIALIEQCSVEWSSDRVKGCNEAHNSLRPSPYLHHTTTSPYSTVIGWSPVGSSLH